MEKKEVRPFGIKDKMGYLFGDFGNDFTFILSSSFLLKFYTDIMGVNAAVVGLVMMIARFVDAFTDVAMGRICDRTKPGKKRKVQTLDQANVWSSRHRIILDLSVIASRNADGI